MHTSLLKSLALKHSIILQRAMSNELQNQPDQYPPTWRDVNVCSVPNPKNNGVFQSGRSNLNWLEVKTGIIRRYFLSSDDEFWQNPLWFHYVLTIHSFDVKRHKAVARTARQALMLHLFAWRHVLSLLCTYMNISSLFVWVLAGALM